MENFLNYLLFFCKMEVRNKKALLIAGDESYMKIGIFSFHCYLLGQAGFSPDSVVILPGEIGSSYTLRRIRIFFEKIKDEDSLTDAIVVYCGHGDFEAIHPAKSPLHYEKVAKLINHTGRFVFISDACYSGSAIPAFRSVGILPSRGLVITSARANEESYGSKLLEALIVSYSGRGVFKRKKIAQIERDYKPRIIVEDGVKK